MTIFQKIKKLVSRHTKDFQVISEHILLQNCGENFYANLFRFHKAGGNSIFPLDKSQMSAIIKSQSIITQMRHSPFGSVLSSSSLQSEKMVRLTDKGGDRRRFLQEVYANFDSNLL